MTKGKPSKTWWMKVLCVFGIHWRGRNDGGGMGDALQCSICGLDTYNSFGHILIHKDGETRNET